MPSIYDRERKIRPPDSPLDLTKCPLYKPRPDICCGKCHELDVENKKTNHEYGVLGPVASSGQWITLFVNFGAPDRLVLNPVAPDCKDPDIISSRR